jgi:hypothetical protein
MIRGRPGVVECCVSPSSPTTGLEGQQIRPLDDLAGRKRTGASSWLKDTGFRVCVRTNKTQTFVWEPGRTADPSAPPDFLSKTVASVDFMRLSLRRAAYVAAGRAVK